MQNGIGLNVAVLGGTFIANFLDFNEVNVAGIFNAVGEAFLIGGEQSTVAYQTVSQCKADGLAGVCGVCPTPP